MPNPTHATHSDRSESSVLFNLQELMRIETERVHADAAAERAVQEAVRLQQQERERHAIETQPKAQAADVAAETERAAALLGVRLKLEAAERVEIQRRDIEHARALELIAAQTNASSTWKPVLVVLAITAALAAGGYFGLVTPMLETMRAREAEAVALGAVHARELAALREQAVRDVSALIVTAPPQPHEVEPTAPPTVTKVGHKRRGGVGVTRREPDVSSELSPLDSEDEDPIFGL